MYFRHKLWYKCKYNIEDVDDKTWGTTNIPWPYFSENDETCNRRHKWSASSACTVEFLRINSSRFTTYVTLDIKHQTGQTKWRSTTLQFKLLDFQERSQPGGEPVTSSCPPACLSASRNSWIATGICFKYGMLWKSVESLRLPFIPDNFIGIRGEYVHFCVNLELEIRSEKKSSGTLRGSIPGLTDMKTLLYRKQEMCRCRCSLRQLFFSRICSS